VIQACSHGPALYIIIDNHDLLATSEAVSPRPAQDRDALHTGDGIPPPFRLLGIFSAHPGIFGEG
jgi:hypothetical protein